MTARRGYQVGESNVGTGALLVQVLGPMTVRRHGEDVDIGPAMLRNLLATLAVNLGRSVPREVIIDALWGEAVPDSASSLIHTYVYRLRQRLATGSDEDVVLRERGGYRLAVDPHGVDLACFYAAHDAGRRAATAGETEAAIQWYERARRYWRGPILADLEPRIRVLPAVIEAQQRRSDAVLEYADLCHAFGRSREALDDLRRASQERPLSESVHARLMRALADSRERTSALAVYDAVRRELAEELGLDPGRELQVAHLAVLQDADSDVSSSTVDVTTHPPRRPGPARRVPGDTAPGGAPSPSWPPVWLRQG